jgi:hypothetical protein
MIARSRAAILFLLLAVAVLDARALPPVPADSNGDRTSELVWRGSTGVSWWFMNGATVTASAYHEVGPGWHVSAAADVTGDGKSDLVWRRNGDGATFLWVLDGMAPTAFADIGIVGDYRWVLAGAGDVDGDGDADLVWQNWDGLVKIWLMQGGAIASQAPYGGLDQGWKVRAVADMDGDGKADLVFHQGTTGEVVVWFMDGLAVRGASIAGILPSTEWTLDAAADANGDGKADLVWRHASGDTWVWLMDGASFVSGASLGNPGTAWKIRAVGDFDGDGKADLVWRHTDGSLYYWKLDGATVSAMQPLPDPGATWEVTGP